MAFKRDLTGLRFGRWEVLDFVRVEKETSYWKCRCDCGTVKEVRGPELTRNSATRKGSKSCGCLAKEIRFDATATRQGMWKSPEYRAWIAMIRRCGDPKNASFLNYGGRGITVCDRWLGESGFDNFLTDMGLRPKPKLSLERKDVDAGYSPSNCVWADQKTQARNKRTSRKVFCRGKTQCVGAWAEESNVSAGRIIQRLNRGWDAEKAIFTEAMNCGRAKISPRRPN